MNKFFWIGILFLGFIYRSYGQEKVAVITDVKQEVKLYPSLRSLLSEQSFPDYFTQDTSWQQTVWQELQTQVRKKLEVTHVYPQDSAAWLTFAYSATPLPAKLKLVTTDRTTAAYFVAFTHTIAFTTTAIETSGLPIRHYQAVAEVKIEDQDRKSVYTHRVTLPFRTTVNPEKGLYGETELSEKDWKDLFLESLAAVFKAETKRLPLRTFYRPVLTNPDYQAFLEKANRYTLQALQSNIPAQKGQPHASKYIYTDTKSGKTYPIDLMQVYTGSLQSPDNNYSSRVDIAETVSQTDYQLWMQFNWQSAPAAAAGAMQVPKAHVQIRCMSQGLLAGDFVLNARNLEGMIGYQVYTLNPVNPKNTYELLANNKLLALIQKAGNGKAGDTATQEYTLYIPKDVSQESQAELAVIFLMHRLATEFGKDYL
ncbi:hypothetical protein Q0590_05215 [Rhodocytophaga aerolata]|uniref:DUF4468 domain-containing protein n=1 Tax=Rhodocytophaga aerolata TaxID=455078 RepID=A0ABT8R0M4_9BACT|nr:hypothetical protein [Rhodocytophaga aerolata]MDO1445636.1 hypothetical protein [Rhodocytophaga aerolata]